MCDLVLARASERHHDGKRAGVLTRALVLIRARFVNEIPLLHLPSVVNYGQGTFLVGEFGWGGTLITE